MYPLFCEFLVTHKVSRSHAAAKIDVTFDFAILLVQPKKYDKKTERGKS